MGCNTGTEKLSRYIETVFTPLTDDKVERIASTENILEIIDNSTTNGPPGNISLASFDIFNMLPNLYNSKGIHASPND